MSFHILLQRLNSFGLHDASCYSLIVTNKLQNRGTGFSHDSGEELYLVEIEQILQFFRD